jgi:chaperonin GroES
LSSSVSRLKRKVPGASSSPTPPRRPQQGEVIAVGPGGRDEAGKLIPIDVEAGDRVLFGKWSGTEIKIDGAEYLIMKEDDIMGVLVEAKAHKKAA